MNEALAETYGERPRQYLADGGYTKFDDIEALEKAGVEVYTPIPAPRDKNRDRYAPQPDDAPAIAAWREGMGSQAAKDASAKPWPAAVSRAGCLQGRIDRALAWPDPQHGVRLAHLILNSARKGSRAPRIHRRSGDRLA